MKKYLFTAICLTTLGLGAAEFQPKISIKPVTNETGEKTYLAQVQIEKKDNDVATIVAQPEVTCVEGALSKVENDQLFFTVLVFKDNEQMKAKTTVLYREDDKEVLSLDQDVVIDNS
ncbi:MAG: hypothetical protein JSS10_08540 [Verrucomicrobia bacterium]|nr:hypothetical protein [Verrucomicrobiota bacterium]